MKYSEALESALDGNAEGKRPPPRAKDEAADLAGSEVVRDLASALGVDPEKIDVKRARAALRRLRTLEED